MCLCAFGTDHQKISDWIPNLKRLDIRPALFKLLQVAAIGWVTLVEEQQTWEGRVTPL